VRPEPGAQAAAAGLRASRADRERVIDLLKAAFAQGRLDRNEFDARVGQALASRTYGELAAITADIPAELTGALPPVSIFVTGYRVHPFVGTVPHPGELDLQPNPTEVETVLTFSLELLREGYEMRRLIRRGVPIHTPTYEVEGQLIWGATARILGDLLQRLN